MKCLVTGASGFIGGHLVPRLLQGGHEVHALLRKTSRLDAFDAATITRHEGDLTRPETLREAVSGMDCVFHLAAVLRARTPAEYLAVNAEGTRAVAEAVRDESARRGRPVRLVYLSSLAAGGPSLDGRPVSPDDVPHPISDYGRTKLAGEIVIRDTLGDSAWVALRPPPVYGPRDRDVLNLFKLLKTGILPLIGGGAQKIPMIHVSDMAEVATLAANSPVSGKVYYVTDGDLKTFRETLEAMAKALNVRPLPIRIPLPVIGAVGALGQFFSDLTGRPVILNRDKAAEVMAPDWSCDDGPARRELGYTPRYNLEQGLADTVAWYRRERWL
jgi:nucleoside-diphosphate-sugar epimerase